MSRWEILDQSHDLIFIAALVTNAQIAYCNEECPDTGEHIIEVIGREVDEEGNYPVHYFILSDDELESLDLILGGKFYFLPF